MSPTPFVKMLWERGSLCEREVIARLELPSLDLSGYTGEEKERLTLEAMQRGEPLIYTAGRLVSMFDEYQSRETAKHVLRAMKENARLGFWNGSPAPYGHEAVIVEIRSDAVKKKLKSIRSRPKSSGRYSTYAARGAASGLSRTI